MPDNYRPTPEIVGCLAVLTAAALSFAAGAAVVCFWLTP